MVTSRPDSGTSGGYLGLTKVSNVSLIVTGTTYTNLPAISGTSANQAALDDIATNPFASVTLADPSNPGGIGESMQIVITDASGAATDALGTLVLPTALSGLQHVSPGTYRLRPDGTGGVAGIQAALDALVFVPASLGAGGAPATANFALTYYAVDGTPGTDTTTSMNIQHDQRTITLSGWPQPTTTSRSRP